MRLLRHPLPLAVSLAACVGVARAEPPARATTRVTWLGHAAFQIVTPGGKVLLIDPWVRNPANPSKNPLADIKKADYLLVTHGHSDHVGDTVEIARATGARLVANFELAQNLTRACGFPAAQADMTTLGNPGGELALGSDGEVTVWIVPAVHSSGLDVPGSDKSGAPMIYGGNPVGFVVRIKDGPTIYHSGDTAYFKDMELIGEAGAVDLALLNIGGHFGMEPAMAARAAVAVKARTVVPHHFKTFPLLTQDAKPFFAQLDRSRIGHVELTPGGALTFEGRTLKR